MALVQHFTIEEFGADIGDDPRRRDFLAAFEPYPCDLIAIHQNLGHRRLQADVDTRLPAHLGHDLRDRAHTPDHMAPGTLVAIYLAKHVMKEDIRAARRVGGGVVANYGVKAERGLDRFALEPLAEKARRGFREQIEDVALGREVETRHAPPLRRPGNQCAQAFADIRRALERQVAENRSHPFQRIVIGRECIGIMLGELAEFGLCSFQPAAQFQIAPVFLRKEIGDWTLDDGVTVLFQSHVANDFGLQQADGVTCYGISETREEFLRNGRTAHDIAPFDDADFQPRAGEIECAYQPVMACSDDDGVISTGHVRLSGLAPTPVRRNALIR